MKSIKVMLAAVLVAGLSFTSCSSDDDGPSTGGNIVGKWTPTKRVENVSGRNQTFNYEDNVATCNKNFTQFADGAIYKEVEYYIIPSSGCAEDVLVTSTWAKTDNVLIADGVTYEVIRLTGSELQIKSSAVVGGSTFTVTEFFTRVN